MKYTNSKEADKKVEEDIQTICREILKEFKPMAIVLFGGFGHGGGSFRKIKRRILPLNDYDLYIITKEKINSKKLEDLGMKCSLALGRGGEEFVKDFEEKYDENKYFHVDLHNITHKNLKKLLPTLRTFDLKTSKIIYGDKSVLEKIPNVKISKSEALRLLFNKLNHFAIAEDNSKIIKDIYAVKGFTDLCSAILIWEGKYVSKYQERIKIFEKLNVPKELKKFVEIATNSKLNKGYKVKNVRKFFVESKKWVLWTLKKLLENYLNSKSEDWKVLCKKIYKKLPYIYFNDYLKGKYLFLAQYYLNVRFFLEGLRRGKFLFKTLLRWRDVGLIIAISLILYSVKEKREAEYYLNKLTVKTKPLKNRILRLYSIYYLQKLI